MMKNIGSFRLPLIIMLLWNISVTAQETAVAGNDPEIIQDARVDELVRKHIRINQVLNTMEGFRIQVFSDSGINSKNKAQAVHNECQARFPGLGVYLSFKSPNYKVRIGDFRTRLDAQRFLIEMTSDYPNAFIIADQINLPKPD